MGTGKQNDNYTFYDGYEGETEVVFTSEQDSLHIWDGYIADIFGEPKINGKGWKGLTRDFNECSGPFSDSETAFQINVKEYLEDAISYKGKEAEFEETSDVLDTLIGWFEDHKDKTIYAMVR